MFKKTIVLALLLVAISLSALPALAGDLQVKLNKEDNNIELTNALSTKVYVLYLEGDDTRIPVHTQIEPGKTIVVPLADLKFPDQLQDAACTFMGQAPDGMKRGEDGKFHLSIDRV